MKLSSSGFVTPFILVHGTEWRCVFNLKNRPSYLRGKVSVFIISEVVGPQSRFGNFVEKKMVLPGARNVDRPVTNIVERPFSSAPAVFSSALKGGKN